jgi:hypothetical protein
MLQDLSKEDLCVVLDNCGLQTLRALDIHSLDVAVQLLLGTLFVITLSRNANAKSVWDAFDAGFPDFLIELGVETDVGCALWK